MPQKDDDAANQAEPEPMPGLAFLKMRDRWVDSVNQSDELSHAASRVGIFIALRMRATNQRSNWPVKKIAKRLKCSTSTVSDALVQLVRARYLVIHRPNRRANQTYFIRMPYGL